MLLAPLTLGSTAAEVLAAHWLHARDRWEGRLEMVPGDPETVFERLYEGGGWAWRS